MNKTIVKHSIPMDCIHVVVPDRCDFYYSPSHDLCYKEVRRTMNGETHVYYKRIEPAGYTVTTYMNELEHEEAVRQDYEKLTAIDDNVIAEYLKQRLGTKIEVYEKEN